MRRVQEEESFEIDDAIVVRETEKALLVEAPILDEEQWVPKSQITEDSEVFNAKSGKEPGSLIVTHWIAQQKGWINE